MYWKKLQALCHTASATDNNEPNHGSSVTTNRGARVVEIINSLVDKVEILEDVDSILIITKEISGTVSWF